MYIKKLSNYNIIYYILILLKSLLILFKFYKFKYIYLYNIYIYILLIFIKLYYINNISIIEINKIINYNYIYFYIYKYLNYKQYKFKVLNNYNNIIEKIISIKKISYTIKKGRVKRYKVILLIGNKCGWIGIGVGKNVNINKAIILARFNSLNNIYYFKYSLLNIYKLKYIFLITKKINIKLQFNIYINLNIKLLFIKYLLECLGYLNCKIIIYYSILKNKFNLLNNLLIILFNNLNL